MLANSDKKVLLIDGNIRRGHLREYLGLKRETGKISPNPSELLLNQRFANCLSVLTPRFDQIIIVSAPILAVTNATITGRIAGATLMVLKAGQHPKLEIEQSAKRVQQAGVNFHGLLINAVNVQSQRYGAGKYSYQYTYKKN